MKPELVTSPKDRISPDSLEVIYTARDGRWSIATMTYDGKPGTVGIRWNGDNDDSLGNPQSRGQPTWFILPGALGEPIAGMILQLRRELEEVR